MSEPIIVRGAALKVRLPITCGTCGRRDRSQVIRIETSHDLSIDELDECLRETQLGTAFPVGWAKYLRNGKDVLICPSCPHP